MTRPHIVHYLKTPDKARRSFALMRRTRLGDTVTTATLVDERVSALNKQVVSGALSPAEAHLELRDYVAKLNREARLERMGQYVASEANLKLFKSYWESEYKHREINQPVAKTRIMQALAALGTLPLLGDRDELLAQVNKHCGSKVRVQRRTVSILNQMRKHFGVGARLTPKKNVRPEFKYLSQKEFKRVMGFVEDARLRALFGVLFYSGVRCGEAFALKGQHLRRGVLLVEQQVNKYGNLAPTKSTGKVRKTVLLADGVEAFEAWTELEEKPEVERTRLSKILKFACRAAFPDKPAKWVRAHDLRHSFAVMMLLDYDVTVGAVAKMLGNSTAVCEEYYLAFIPEDEVLLSVLAKTKK